jgi:hypothetical protein
MLVFAAPVLVGLPTISEGYEVDGLDTHLGTCQRISRSVRSAGLAGVEKAAATPISWLDIHMERAVNSGPLSERTCLLKRPRRAEIRSCAAALIEHHS